MLIRSLEIAASILAYGFIALIAFGPYGYGAVLHVVSLVINP